MHNSEELSVRGYVEVLRHLPRLLRMRNNLKKHWTETAPPKLFVGVDAPDFNLDLELALKASGVPTVHVVCPSIWAWRMQRIHKIKQACSHVMCVFPFESEILDKAGIESSYIGHPMAAIVPTQYEINDYRNRLGLDVHTQLLAVLPGSRRSELKYLGPVFIQTALELRKHKQQLRFVTPLPRFLLETFKAMVPAELKDHWTVVEGQSHECIAAADAVLLASGTATLEAMMYRKPMVIAYKMPWLSYMLMKDKGYMPYIGLPNILLQEFAVPELIQHHATPQALCAKVLFQLDNDQNRDRLQKLFEEQHEILLKPSGELASQVMQRYLQ